MSDDVFVLGAGFSRQVAEGMPLTSDLVEPLAEALEAKFPGLPLGNLVRSVADLEAVLTYLAEPQPGLSEEDNLMNRAAFVHASTWLAGSLYNRQEWCLGSGPLPAALGSLVKEWHGRRTRVLTLNYDTLVESALLSLASESGANDWPKSYSSVYPDTLPWVRSRYGGTFLSKEREETFVLLKLHGSLNWFVSSLDPVVPSGDTAVYEAECVDPWNRNVPRYRAYAEVLEGARGLRPLLIPPVTSKSALLANGWIRSLWRDAARALGPATTVYLIGYSMPPADNATRMLLASHVDGKRLVPVNTDPEVVARLRALFPGADIVESWVGGGVDLDRFAEAFASGAAST